MPGDRWAMGRCEFGEVALHFGWQLAWPASLTLQQNPLNSSGIEGVYRSDKFLTVGELADLNAQPKCPA
jgi:hypothetical protein